MDQDLFEHRPALTTDIGRQRPADEPGGDRRVADPLPRLVREPSTRVLELTFERLEDVPRERSRPTLEFALVVTERQVHAASMAHASPGAPASSRGAGRRTGTNGRPGARPQRSVNASLPASRANVPAKVRRIQVSTRGREITWVRIEAAKIPYTT